MVSDSSSSFIIFTVFFTHRDGMRTSLLLISSGKTTLRNILTSCVEAAPHAAARASPDEEFSVSASCMSKHLQYPDAEAIPEDLNADG
jgi:hypothetical protein